MSFLKDFLRSRRCWKRDGNTPFGEVTYYSDLSDYPIFFDMIRGSYEDINCNHLSYSRSQHFHEAVNKLTEKLMQAALHSDYGENQANITYFNELKQFTHKALDSFAEKRSAIHKKLNEFTGQNEKEIQQWLQENETLLTEFFQSLDKIYSLRTTSAKFKDFLWELADALLAVLILAGLTALAIKLVGSGMLGRTLAYFVAPATTAKMIEGTAAGVAVVTTGLFKFFKSEERVIREAIQQDLYLPNTVKPAGARR
ncbi:MAG: hypothetical protein K0S27_1486 [Gammaproteobacteria bacterium]|jgi:hypothetical protein|nr:hypothetical protein [Gammaproteobacteria bacterium]